MEKFKDIEVKPCANGLLCEATHYDSDDTLVIYSKGLALGYIDGFSNVLEELKEEVMHFTIDLQPVSKKNSQQILMNRTTKKPFIMPSKKYKEYERAALWFIPKDKYIDYPVNIKCLFYMGTHRKCDLTNMLEAVDDIMVHAGLLADDNYSIIEAHDGSRILYDKERPRTEVYIEKIKTEEDG